MVETYYANHWRQTMEKKKNQTVFDKMPTEYKEILLGIVDCKDGFTKGQALDYLVVHKQDFFNIDNPSEYGVFLAMVEELFGNMLAAPLWEENDGIWKYENKIGDVLINGVQKILDILESNMRISEMNRTEVGRRDYYDLITLVQNMHLNLYYYYRHRNDVYKAKAELNAILS